MFTLYLTALASARNPYQIGLLFTHKNGDFGAISVTERICVTPISTVESHISDSYCATLWCSTGVNKWRRGLELTDTEVNIQRWTGIQFTRPSQPTTPARCSTCVNIALLVHSIPYSFSCRHETLSSIVWTLLKTAGQPVKQKPEKTQTDEQRYRKIPKISPSMYKPLQI